MRKFFVLLSAVSTMAILQAAPHPADRSDQSDTVRIASKRRHAVSPRRGSADRKAEPGGSKPAEAPAAAEKRVKPGALVRTPAGEAQKPAPQPKPAIPDIPGVIYNVS